MEGEKFFSVLELHNYNSELKMFSELKNKAQFIEVSTINGVSALSLTN